MSDGLTGCYGEMQTHGPIVVRARLVEWDGRLRVDLREWVRRKGRLVPTLRGIALDLAQLPQLETALLAAEGAAVRAGALRAEDFPDIDNERA